MVAPRAGGAGDLARLYPRVEARLRARIDVRTQRNKKLLSERLRRTHHVVQKFSGNIYKEAQLRTRRPRPRRTLRRRNDRRPTQTGPGRALLPAVRGLQRRLPARRRRPRRRLRAVALLPRTRLAQRA